MLKNAMILTMIFSIALLTACGDSKTLATFDDGMQLQALDTTGQESVCTDLIGTTPQTCWELQNQQATEQDTVANCMKRFKYYTEAATIDNLKSCYNNADTTTCKIDENMCLLFKPHNGENPQYDTLCLEDLQCDEWNDYFLCYQLCLM